MIRQNLDVVPVVQPKHRLEEDARLAAEKRQRSLAGSSAAAAQPQVVRYIISNSDKTTGEEPEEPNRRNGLRLFALDSTFPSDDSRSLRTLHVLDASRGTWRHVTRSVYRGVLFSRHSTEKPDDSDDDGEDYRFSSLPLPGYENKSCFLLALPPATDGDVGVAQARPLNVPIHSLRCEPADPVKEGEGISTSWYSGVDTRKVQFKRSYIDDDYGGEDDADDGFASDDAGKGKRSDNTKRSDKNEGESSYKKNKLEISNVKGSENDKEKVDAESGADVGGGNLPEHKPRCNKGQTAAAVAGGSSAVSVVALPEILNKAANKCDESLVEGSDLESITVSYLKQCAATGRTTMPFSDLAKAILKLHPLFTEMKAKHQSVENRQEAIDWFRTSQAAVRTHVLSLGYIIDSAGNVYLSQKT